MSTSARTTVEECLELDVNLLRREGLIVEGEHRRATLSWTKPPQGELLWEVQLETEWDRDAPLLWICYGYETPEGDVQKGAQHVQLEATSNPESGKRWWMRCPAPSGENPQSHRRCGKLYKPPGIELFGCRNCFELTYRTCQTQGRQTHLDRMFRWQYEIRTQIELYALM